MEHRFFCWRWLCGVLLCFALAPSLTACSTSAAASARAAHPPRDVAAETLTVACGRCVFGMDVEGCPWAAKVDGQFFLVKGAVPSDDQHDAHAKDGMCNVPRKAVVRGRLENGVLTVTEMRLLP